MAACDVIGPGPGMIEQGEWVEPVEHGPPRSTQRPVYHLAGEVEVSGRVKAATVRATARGIYELFVNGHRVGDAELLPGCTAYRKRLQVHEHDVAHLLQPGRNAVGVLLSDGWWRGQGGGASRLTDAYGPRTGLLLELRVELESGQALVMGTDETWRSTRSHILAADLVAGEVHDLRRAVVGWACAGTDRSTWDAVHVRDHPKDVLVPAEGPPVRRVQELPAVAVHELASGRHVVDFGQNSNGWVRLSELGPSGTTVTLVYGERLDEDGDVTQEPIAHRDPARPDLSFQTDVVTSAGDGAVFEPRHSTKGFRYVRVEGHPGPLEPAAITSVVVHSDMARIGGFACSDDRVNRLHSAAEWSFRGNACDIPTDCPHRERAGWTGDWQVFVETAAYLYDVGAFSARWLRDLEAEQWPDGTVLNIVPDQHDLSLEEHSRWRGAQGSSGWGDAACHVPWELYRAYGGTDVLRAQLGSMRRWVDWAADRAASARHPARAESRPQPLPHERYIWDTGFHFGEWTEPDAPPNPLPAILDMDHGPTATAFLHRSARELADAAAALDDEALSERYGELAHRVREAWVTEFVDDAGHVQPQRQANLVRALAFGLVPDWARETAVADLVDLVREAGTHLGTGFLATPFLLPVLADNGHLGLAYELLLQDSPPSWMHMIESGATTIWEDWTGRESLNHYSKGAVVSFLHRYVAGLQPLEPGYRRFRVAPRPGGGITWAHTFHDARHGRIEVSWHLRGEEGRVEVTVPADTHADVSLPDGSAGVLTEGEHSLSWPHGMSARR